VNHLKGYATAGLAARSKAARQPGAWLDEHCPCGLVHVRQAKEAPAGLQQTARSPIPDAVRALVLARDGRACFCCGTSIVGERYSLGHRLRASQGGKAVPSNLITLLGWGGEQCHGRIDNRADPSDEAKGYTVRSWGSPLLVPVMLFSPGGSGAMVWLDDLGGWSVTEPEAVAA
jgi:hypothetical protein